MRLLLRYREWHIMVTDIRETVATCQFAQQLLIPIHIQRVCSCLSFSQSWHCWARFCDIPCPTTSSSLSGYLSRVRGSGWGSGVRGPRSGARDCGHGVRLCISWLASDSRLADRLPWNLHHQQLYLPSLPGQSSDVLCHYPHSHPPSHHYSTPPPPPHLPPLHCPSLHHHCPVRIHIAV